jgi:hypothetical protein
VLLVTSSLALAVAMVLACIYAAGTFLATDWLDIPTMLRWHGAVQALGFTLPGLAGWNMVFARGDILPDSSNRR